jgi:hypothetical protein
MISDITHHYERHHDLSILKSSTDIHHHLHSFTMHKRYFLARIFWHCIFLQQAEAFTMLPSAFQTPRTAATHDNANHGLDGSNYNIKINNPKRLDTKIGIGSGFTFFDDGDELLVSAQKPLGILLEEREPSNENYNDRGTRSTSITLQDADIDTYAQCRHMGCRVSEVTQGGTADRAGVKEGDILVAVQNADVANASFEKVMERIIDAPKVVNLRFWRKER